MYTNCDNLKLLNPCPPPSNERSTTGLPGQSVDVPSAAVATGMVQPPSQMHRGGEEEEADVHIMETGHTVMDTITPDRVV